MALHRVDEACMLIKAAYGSIKEWAEQQKKINEIEKKYGCSISRSCRFTGPTEKIRIGKDTRINGFANFRFKQGRIEIGNDVLFAQYVTVVTNTYEHKLGQNIREQDMYSKSVKISDGVWIGVYGCILPGVRIGEGAIIGAHSLVNKNVPEYEIWGGVPARKIGVRK